jgi:hypothetical protein
MQSDPTPVVRPTAAKEFLSGDKKAFEQLYDQYAPLLYGFICRLIDDQKQADQILQQVFTSLWQERNLLYASEEPLLSIMMKMVRSIVFRSSQKEKVVFQTQNHKIANYVYDKLITAEGLTRRPETDVGNEALQLIYIGEKSPQEVARHLGIGPEEIWEMIRTAINRQKQLKP